MDVLTRTPTGRLVWYRRSQIIAINIALTVVLCETASAVLMWSPRLLGRFPESFVNHFQRLYMNRVRHYIQFEPGMARYDSGLFYTLRPGRFVFSNMEFSNEYTVNSLGVRDSESALQAPEIVVIGDSFAMGWGVQQNETFPKVLESLTRMKTLNAGISSYGTVREMTLLDRIDTSKLGFLIIQYADNDLTENLRFYQSKNGLPIRTEEEYHWFQRANSPRYWPGLYSFFIARELVSGLLGRTGNDLDCCRPSDRSLSTEGLFLNTLINGSHKNLQGVQVVVLELDSHDVDLYLTQSIPRALTDPNLKLPDWVRSTYVLKLAGKIRTTDFYVIDDHLRPSGHKVIAQELASIVHEIKH